MKALGLTVVGTRNVAREAELDGRNERLPEEGHWAGRQAALTDRKEEMRASHGLQVRLATSAENRSILRWTQRPGNGKKGPGKFINFV